MHSAMDLAYLTLKASVTFTVLLNELAVLTSPWIIVPSRAPDAARAALCPAPMWTALAYAVSEPVWTILWTAIGWLDPWITVLQLPALNLWAAEFTLAGLRQMLRDERQSNSPSLKHLDSTFDDDGAPKKPTEAPASSMHVLAALIIPLEGTAAVNSALASLMEELYRDPEKYRAPLHLGLTSLGMVLYILCHFGDWRLCVHTFRTIPWSPRAWNVTKSALPYAIVLVGGKTVTRLLLSLPNPFAVVVGLATSPSAQPWATHLVGELGKYWSMIPAFNVPWPYSWILFAMNLCLQAGLLVWVNRQ